MRVMSGLVAAVLTGIATAQPLPDPQIDYWTVPWENSRPRDPDLDRNGIVWFVDQTGDYVASFDPKSKQFKKTDLDKGTGPHNLIVGEDHAIWYSGNRAAHNEPARSERRGACRRAESAGRKRTSPRTSARRR